jgi:hypothetical protein
MPQFPQLRKPNEGVPQIQSRPQFRPIDAALTRKEFDLSRPRREFGTGFAGGGPQIQSRPDIGGPMIHPPSEPGIQPPTNNPPVALKDLGKFLENVLGNPSGFDTKTFKRSQKQAMDEIRLLEKRALGEQRASAASRGVFFGTPGSSGEARVREGAQIARNRSLTDLLQRQAETLGSDRSRAIDQAMGFGREARQSQLDKIMAGNQLMGTGQEGVPTLQNMLAAFGGNAPPGIDPAIFAMLGQLSQGRSS